MKKQYKFLIGFFALITSISIAGAQSLSNLMDTLGADTSFGYTNDKKIEIKGVGTTGSITLTSPKLRDGGGNIIKSYTIMYSQYPLTELLEKTDLLSQTKEIIFEYTGANNSFDMNITINETKTGKYYIVIIPKDNNNKWGQISNEVWVNLGSKIYGDSGDESIHGTAGDVDMSLTHISHSINANTVTLTWSAIAGTDTIKIDVMKPGASEYESLGVVRMDSERYKYTPKNNGEYTFRFFGVDCGTQTKYTMTMNGITETPEKTPTKKPTGVITKVPKTGPGENVIVILLIAGLIYLGYSKLYKKTK